MTHDDVRTLLARTSEVPPAPTSVPVQRVIGKARVRRRRRRAGMVTGVAAAVAVAVALPATVPADHADRLNLTVPGSAAILAAGNWSALPDAPFPEHTPSAAVWTGELLYAWSGTDRRTYRDGAHVATYDPATRTWQRLPDPPLAARSDPSMFWTGSQLFVWGGGQFDGPNRYDGALYDPRTRAWRTVAAAPASLRNDSQWQAEWVHGMAVLGDIDGTALAGYDPARDRWTTLAPVPALYGRGNAEVTVVAAGQELYAISEPGPRRGLAVLRYDWAGRRWVPPLGAGTSPLIADSVLGDTGQLGTPVWDGHEVIIPASTPDCAATSCPNPPTFGQPLRIGGLSLRVIKVPARAGKATTLPRLGGLPVWTGQALIVGTHVWDPRTGIWRDLPSPPQLDKPLPPGFPPTGSYSALRVWAGSGLLAVYPPALRPTRVREDWTTGWLAG
jgi:hypothetical protein